MRKKPDLGYYALSHGSLDLAFCIWAKNTIGGRKMPVQPTDEEVKIVRSLLYDMHKAKIVHRDFYQKFVNDVPSKEEFRKWFLAQDGSIAVLWAYIQNDTGWMGDTFLVKVSEYSSA